MQMQYVIAVIWLAGFFLSRWMLKVEHEAEGNEYTNGDRMNEILISILSLVMVAIMLAKAWSASVAKYWKQPVKPKINKAE